MTRYNIYRRAMIVARQSVPSLAVDIDNCLYDMSVAEQKIAQAAPGAIRRTATVTLDTSSTTGQYTLPADTLTVDKVWFSPPNNTSRAMNEVKLWPYDQWLKRVTWDVWWAEQVEPTPVMVPDWYEGALLICSVNEGTLYVEPLAIAGTLTLRYDPILTPYSPDDPIWAAYGTDPEPAMRTNGLDDEALGPATDGIIQWCAAKMLRAAPGGIEYYRAEIMNFEANFERSIWPVASAIPGNINNTRARPVPIGGRF